MFTTSCTITRMQIPCLLFHGHWRFFVCLSYIVNLMNIGKQKGGNDCGLFAVAVLTSLANGVDVTKAKFDQALMRPHLVHCIDSKEMTPFLSSFIDTIPANSIIKTVCL